MDTSREPTLCSLEEFQAEREEETRRADELTREIYRDRVKKILEDISEKTSKPGTSPQTRWTAATDTVLKLIRGVKNFTKNGARVSDQLLSGEVTFGIDDHSIEVFTIKNVIKEYQELSEEAFLLLNAPSDVKVSYDLEKEAREHQLQEFYNVCIGIKNKSKYPAMSVIVDKYEDILTIMGCFFKCMASNSKRASIVFNGHGKPSGNLHLQNDPKAPHNTVFLEDVYKTWSQLKKCLTSGNGDQVILPVGVTVVLAHCYSFIHMQPMDHRPVIEVVSLASPLHPETTYEYSPGKDNQLVKASRHIQLWKYARHRSVETEPVPEESDLNPDSVMVIPSFLIAMSLQTNSPENVTNNFSDTLDSVSKHWNPTARRCSCSLPHRENKVGDAVLGVGFPSLVLGGPGKMVRGSKGSGEHSVALLAKGALRLMLNGTGEIDIDRENLPY